MGLIEIGIILSLLITLMIGLFGSKQIKNKTENYYVTGRNMSIPIVGLALVGQAIDGNSTLGNTTLSSDFGFWAGATMVIGLALALFLFGKFFAEKLNSMNLLTLADLFRIKYNRNIEVIASILMIFSFGILLAGNLAAVGILMKIFFALNYETIIILISIMVVIYSMAGGLISDILTDLFQIGLLVFGLGLTLVYIVFKYGLELFTSGDLISGMSITQMIFPGEGALINWATIVALGFGNLLAIDFASRIFSARTPKIAKKGCYMGAWMTLIIGIPFSLLAFFIQSIGISPVEGIPLLFVFSEEILPVFISMFLISGIVGVSLSTIDGAILSMGNILAHNVLNIKEGLKKVSSADYEKTYLYFTRLSLVPIAGIGMIFAMLLPSPGILLTVAFDIMFASLLVPFVFAFISKKPDSNAALWAIICGGISRVLFAIFSPTSFGVDNTFFYIENSIITTSLDGLGTIISPLIALVVYLYVASQTGKERKNYIDIINSFFSNEHNLDTRRKNYKYNKEDE
ncbi:MAG: sodium:solute symporter [Candidatus Aenigmarchaeota archaeon]|nr:sodium:solute symporter [Candidatus Aenigmarchaeota archaeon]